MAAQKSVINAEAMARLRKDTKFAMSAKKAVSQFNNFAGPVGRYFARLQRLDFRFHKTGGHPCFTFYHTCLARCPDAGSDSNIIDQQHAGMPMKVFREVKVSDKMTRQDAWDATMVDLQAYDIKTRNFGVRNGIEVQDEGVTFWADLGDALDALEARRPALIIDVIAGKPQPGKALRNFVNVRETVAEEVVARFASPHMEISDEEMEVPDEGDDDEGTGPTAEEQLAMIMGLNREKLIEALTDQDLKYMWECMSLAELQSVGSKFVKDEELPPPETYHGRTPCHSWVREEEPELADDGTANTQTASDAIVKLEEQEKATIVKDDEEGTDSDDEEEDDDVYDKAEDSATTTAGLLIKLQNTIANENRDQLKSRLRGMGALLPDTKFKKPDVQSDDYLRQWIVDVHTGKVAPVMIIAPSELPPF